MATPEGITDYAPSYASYNWTGAPSDFSLTTNVHTGGDSSECGWFCITLARLICLISHRKSEQMVSIR